MEARRIKLPRTHIRLREEYARPQMEAARSDTSGEERIRRIASKTKYM